MVHNDNKTKGREGGSKETERERERTQKTERKKVRNEESQCLRRARERDGKQSERK